MAYNYDKLYGETPDALGEPTPQIVSFFDQLGPKALRVLDIGCGQGRDALFIARRGHSVVGVDLSAYGIRDLNAAAARETLAIEGIVADVADYVPEGMFDIILIDRTLHMLPKAPRLAVLQTLLDHVAAKGWIVIADEVSNMAAFDKIISNHAAKWQAAPTERSYLFAQRS